MYLAAVMRPDGPAPQGQESLAQGLSVFRVVHTARREVFAPKGLEGDCQVLQLESTSALLVNFIWRPFRARRSGGRFPRVKTLGWVL